MKNFAKTRPELTFINAASGAQETTKSVDRRRPSPLNMDGAALGQVGRANTPIDQDYKKIATVAKTIRSYTQVFGWCSCFCGAGGQSSNLPGAARYHDFASVIAALPYDVRCDLSRLGCADAVNFLNQYQAGAARRI